MKTSTIEHDSLARPNGAPSSAELVDRASSLVPTLRSHARATETNRRVSAETTQILRDADLYRLMQPARFGGYEYGFDALINVTAEIGRGCGSTGWCYGLAAVHQWLVGTFPLQAQEDVWKDNPEALVCGSYAPAAKAAAVDGGYTVSGKWEFASNCLNSDWALLGVMFPPAQPGEAPTAGFVIVPASDYRIEDTWFTVGLAGTGSNTIFIDAPVFVPSHRKLTFAQASSNNPPGALANQNPLFKIPFLSAAPVAIISPAIGMVQGSLDEFLAWTGTRQTRGAVVGSGTSVAQFPQVQTRVAEAAIAIDIARLLLQRATQDVQTQVAAGLPISVDIRIRNRRDQAYSARLLMQAATCLFDAVGGAGLSLDSSIQRNWRDANAVSRHVSFNWDAVSTMYGQHRFGLEPKGQY